jgi:hypothetical protein
MGRLRAAYTVHIHLDDLWTHHTNGSVAKNQKGIFVCGKCLIFQTHIWRSHRKNEFLQQNRGIRHGYETWQLSQEDGLPQ